MLQERLTRRQVRLGFFAGTFRFAGWTIGETLRAMRYAIGLIREQAVKSVDDAPMVLPAKDMPEPMPAPVAAPLAPAVDGVRAYG